MPIYGSPLSRKRLDLAKVPPQLFLSVRANTGLRFREQLTARPDHPDTSKVQTKIETTVMLFCRLTKNSYMAPPCVGLWYSPPHRLVGARLSSHPD
jgi:hypothetical protein